MGAYGVRGRDKLGDGGGVWAPQIDTGQWRGGRPSPGHAACSGAAGALDELHSLVFLNGISRGRVARGIIGNCKQPPMFRSSTL